MPNFQWIGHTYGYTFGFAATGAWWGWTGNWRNEGGAAASALPKGGDVVIFGASAVNGPLRGGFVNGAWNSDVGAVHTDTGNIIIKIQPGFGPTYPYGTPQIGFSAGYAGTVLAFGSTAGLPLSVKASHIIMGSTHSSVQACFRNSSVGNTYSIAQVDGATFGILSISGDMEEIIVTRGSLRVRDAKVQSIRVEGTRGTTLNPDVTTDGYGVGSVYVHDNATVDNLIVTSKANAAPVIVEGNVVTYLGEAHTMGPTAAGFTHTTIQRNVRLGGGRRVLDRRTGKLKWEYP